jgi:hypothetical protein
VFVLVENGTQYHLPVFAASPAAAAAEEAAPPPTDAAGRGRVAQITGNDNQLQVLMAGDGRIALLDLVQGRYVNCHRFGTDVLGGTDFAVSDVRVEGRYIFFLLQREKDRESPFLFLVSAPLRDFYHDCHGGGPELKSLFLQNREVTLNKLWMGGGAGAGAGGTTAPRSATLHPALEKGLLLVAGGGGKNAVTAFHAGALLTDRHKRLDYVQTPVMLGDGVAQKQRPACTGCYILPLMKRPVCSDVAPAGKGISGLEMFVFW